MAATVHSRTLPVPGRLGDGEGTLAPGGRRHERGALVREAAMCPDVPIVTTLADTRCRTDPGSAEQPSSDPTPISALAARQRPLPVPDMATSAVATMASAHPGRGGIRVVPDHHQAVRAFLDPLPVGDLYGLGPVQAATLKQYGLRTVGRLAHQPLQTIQRILGGREGRLGHERARGIDSRPVTPSELPQRASASSGSWTATPSTRTWCAPKSSTPWWTSPISSASAIRSPRASLSACPAPVAAACPDPRTRAEPSAFPDDLRDTAMAVVRTSRTGAGPGAHSIPLSVHAPSADCKGRMAMRAVSGR